MSWLTQAFEKQSIAWLIISTFVAIIAALLSSLFTYRVKRREIIHTAITDMEKRRGIIRIETEKEREERIRLEIIKWANPILTVVRELKGRLHNILDEAGYLPLSTEYENRVNPNWSVSYDYFMSSTLFVFGQYFAWIQMLQEELNFELFQSQQAQKGFFDSIYEVRSALSAFPPSHYECSGEDTQVFSLQQRAIGELLILREGDSWRCMSYPEFVERINDSDSILNQHLQPLRLLLDHLTPNEDCRWKRLNATLKALSKLEYVCNELLSLPKKLGTPGEE